MLRPSIMSLASKLAEGGQGVALGLNNAFQSLGRVVGPLWAGFTFDLNLSFPYMSGALIMFGTFLYAIWKVGDHKVQSSSLPSPAAVPVTLEEE
jgi:DHA1 family multidrug resistance protein-like MFS transporter